MRDLPYRFIDTEGEERIAFDRFDLPEPWINYLSNGKLHAFVSQTGGGMCWWLSPMTFRISRYRFYNLPKDSPGFYIYLRDGEGRIWSPTFRPCKTPVDARSAYHAPGYSVFEAEIGGVRATLTLFAATDCDSLIWKLDIENTTDSPVRLDAFAYVELSQLLAREENTLGYYLKWNTRAVWDEGLDAISYAYTAWMHPRAEDAPLIYFASSDRVESFCCDRDRFCGSYRDESEPREVERGRLSNTELGGGEPCGALHTEIELSPRQKRQISYFLGVERGALSDYDGAVERVRKSLDLLRREGEVDRQLEKCRAWWRDQLGAFRCKIPDKDAERAINIWTPLQCVQTARYSRSISSSASGVRGIGFRDSAQDMLAQAYRKPEWALKMLEYLASQQLPDGHPVHIMWPEENRPAQDITRSDNHLWMIYLAYAIVAETGDASILEREIPYLSPDLLTHTGSGTLWEHLLRGIEFTEDHLGEHGLPLILFSDWNDHLGPFGRRGRGESVMVAEQFVYALTQMSELAELLGDKKSLEKFNSLAARQREAISKYAWDGKWFLRGFDDDGAPIGSQSAKYMRTWINPQSWMVISGAESEEKCSAAMKNTVAELDTGLGLMLNAPSLPGWPSREADKANGLPAGYSENGGIFCQANCWAIIAEALLGHGNEAWRLYSQIQPYSVIERVGLEVYRSEVYAYCSTLLGRESKDFGRGVVSQVTGTAAWMDVAATQYILGIRSTPSGLLIDPSIPSEWDGYSVKRLWRGHRLDISVENPEHIEHGIKKIYVNGKEIGGGLITEKQFGDDTDASVLVIMGK